MTLIPYSATLSKMTIRKSGKKQKLSSCLDLSRQEVSSESYMIERHKLAAAGLVP